MDIKILSTVFFTVFIAELGDKTQLATLLLASDKDVNKWMVFFGASAALVATSAIGVLFGGAVSQFVSERMLNWIAGAVFILIGAWTIWRV